MTGFKFMFRRHIVKKVWDRARKILDEPLVVRGYVWYRIAGRVETRVYNRVEERAGRELQT